MGKLLLITFILSLLVLSGCGKQTETNKTVKELMPTIDDFEIGWELLDEQEKNSLDWNDEFTKLMMDRGFKEGVTSIFVNNKLNLEIISLDITKYSSEGCNELINKNIREVKKRERITKDDMGNDIIIKLYPVKSPKIGDNRIMWGELSNKDSKSYNLIFTKQNIYSKITCVSANSEISIGNCIKYAKLIEKKI